MTSPKFHGKGVANKSYENSTNIRTTKRSRLYDSFWQDVLGMGSPKSREKVLAKKSDEASTSYYSTRKEVRLFNFFPEEVEGMGLKKNRAKGKNKAEEEGLEDCCLPLKKKALYLEENENRDGLNISLDLTLKIGIHQSFKALVDEKDIVDHWVPTTEAKKTEKGLCHGESSSKDGNNSKDSEVESCLVHENPSLSLSEGEPSKGSKIDQKEEGNPSLNPSEGEPSKESKIDQKEEGNPSLNPSEGEPSKESKIDQKEEGNQLVVPKKKRRVVIRPTIIPHQPHPAVLPMEYKNRLRDLNGGIQIQGEVLVIEKRLHEADVKKEENRLSIPFSQIKNEFLSEEQKAYLQTRIDNGKHVSKLEAKLMDPMGELRQVYLRRWAMTKTLSEKEKKSNAIPKVSKMYVINGTNWKRQ